MDNIEKIGRDNMQALSCKFLSVKIRGLRDKSKRLKVFNWVKEIKSDITLFQETFSVEENENEWTRDWEGGQVIFSHGTKHSRGCLITVNKNLDLKILKKKLM